MTKRSGSVLAIAATVLWSLWSDQASADTWRQIPSAPKVDPSAGGKLWAGVDDGHALFVQALAASAWQFDPATSAWTAVAAPPAACESVVGLGDGTFLCAYGAVSGGARATTSSLWSPKAAAWTATSPMKTDRVRPIAARLADGSALFCGGGSPSASGGALTSCERYDPVGKSWTVAASMPGTRCSGAGFFALADGRAVMIGTDASCAVPAPTLFYDPKADAWTTVASPGPSPGPVAATKSGIAFIGPAGAMFVVDPKTGAPSAIDAPAGFRPDDVASLGDRWVLVIGSPFSMSPQPEQAALLDPATRTYRSLAAPPSGAWPAIVVSAGDSVLLAGGYQPGATPGSSVPFTATDVITMARDGAACTAADACGSLACTGGKCGATCGADADCATGLSCEGGACVTSLALGASCARDGSCASGHCLDGHCCGDSKGCAPYTCAASGGCATSCTDASLCAAGNLCVSGACVPDPTIARCSADLSQSVPKVGAPAPCAPYLCDTSKGACRNECSSSDQCAAGFLCEAASQHCVPGSASSSGSGGCALGGGASAGVGAIAIAALAAAGLARRARAARGVKDRATAR